MVIELRYFERKGAVHTISSNDPWRDLLMGVGEWERPAHMASVSIGGHMHTIIDVLPTHGDGEGLFITWEHGETGELHVSGHIDGETRHWSYEGFVAWRKRRAWCRAEIAKHHRTIESAESKNTTADKRTRADNERTGPQAKIAEKRTDRTGGLYPVRLSAPMRGEDDE